MEASRGLMIGSQCFIGNIERNEGGAHEENEESTAKSDGDVNK